MKGLLERAVNLTLDILLWVISGLVLSVATYFVGLELLMPRVVVFGISAVGFLIGYIGAGVLLPYQLDKDVVKLCMRRTIMRYANIWPSLALIPFAIVMMGWLLDLPIVQAFIIGFGTVAVLALTMFIIVCVGDRRRIFVRREFAEMF